MPLVPRSANRDKVLDFGPFGAGKTKKFADIMLRYVETKTPGHFFLIDQDQSILDFIEAYDIPDDYYTYMSVQNYHQIDDAVEVVVKEARPGDWTLFDKAECLWDFSQTAYFQEVEGTDSKMSYLDRKAKQGAKKWGLVKDVQWQLVNTRHHEVMRPLIFENASNLFFVCSPTSLGDDLQGNDKFLADMYGDIGVRPAGQKLLSQQMRTILYSKHTKGRFLVTTHKDKVGREYLKEEDVADQNFVDYYLCDVAGWKVQK